MQSLNSFCKVLFLVCSLEAGLEGRDYLAIIISSRREPRWYRDDRAILDQLSGQCKRESKGMFERMFIRLKLQFMSLQ
jgi:hypothetical protein